MRFFKLLTLRPGPLSSSRRPTRPRQRLSLEILEDRTVPSTLFVVPSTVPTDSTHFHDLASAGAAAVSGTDTIQIEPSSVPGNATIVKVLTIQGDPAVGPANLPQIPNLVLAADDIVLSNLNAGSVTIQNGHGGETISSSLIANVSKATGPMPNGSDVFSGNTITGSLSLVQGRDSITENLFTSVTTGPMLSLVDEASGLVSLNAFTGTANNAIAISDIDSGNSGAVGFESNVITLSGAGGTGIAITSRGTNGDWPNIFIGDNQIITGNTGTAVSITKLPSAPVPGFSDLVGNNFVGNQVGVNITGNGSGSGDDFGHVSLTANDFHGYTGTNGHFAIITSNSVPTTDTVSAPHNIFSIPSANAVNAGAGSIDVSSALDANHAFVEILYNDFLKRSASPVSGELDFWASQLAGSGGQGAVVDGIIRSGEGYTRLVDSLYLKILGRTADAGGEAYWVGRLQGGATMETVIAGFLGSTEYAARANTLAFAPAGADANYIQSLYTLLLGRTASADEVNYWLGQLASSNRSVVALGFLNSAEFRTGFVTALYFTNTPVPAAPLVTIAPNLLNRATAPLPSEIAGWVNTGQDLLTLEGNIASSMECFTNG
jgi:hypothetical protein